MNAPWRRSLPPPPRGRVLARRNIIAANVITMVPVLGIFVSLTIGISGAMMLDAGREVPTRDLPAFFIGLREAGWPVMPLGVVLVVAGVLMLVRFSWVGVARVSLYADRFYRWLCSRAIARRPDAVVKPDDPLAVFVEVVPRANWSKAMLENAEEIGFLAFDYQRSLLLFEGDLERWVIPGHAIATLASDHHTVTGGSASITYEYICFRVREADGSETEVLLRPRTGTGMFGIRRRIHRLFCLMAKIDMLRPADQQSFLAESRAHGLTPEQEQHLRAMPLP